MIGKKIFLAVSIIGWLAAGLPSANAETANINFSFGHDASTEAAVNWSSPTAVDAAAVMYGLAPGDYPFEQEAVEVDDAPGLGVFYEARITELIPDTTYYFVVGSGEDLSEELSFTTGPVSNPVYGEVSFMAWGDSRGHDYSINAELDDLLNYAIANHPTDIHFFTGDATYAAADEEMIAWLAAVEEINKITPILATAGNHEFDLAKFYAMFALPHNDNNEDIPEAYFSVDYGNVHFIVLNDNVFGIDSDDVTDWLRRDLEDTDKLWKIAFHHRPLYSSSNHGCSEDLIASWEDIYNEFGVDLVFNGHDHNYERSFPLNRAAGSGGESAVVDNPWDGTTYIVTNGMGDNLYSSGTNFWTAYSESRTNYSIITITDDSIELIAVDPIQDEVFDQISYTKPVSDELRTIADNLLLAQVSSGGGDDDDDPFGCSSTAGAGAGDAAFILILSLALMLIVSSRRTSKKQA
jgi:predicted MPP superfamily phosphohydrolase